MDIREILLTVIQEQISEGYSLQSGTILREAGRRVGRSGEQALLTQWHDLVRLGYVAWGYNIANPDPPFVHLTEHGRRALAHLSRDPGNPAGYLRLIQDECRLNPIADSYLHEGLSCYNNGLYKASAVMIGATSESTILELRDLVVDRLNNAGQSIPSKLKGWQIKRITDGLKGFFDSNKGQFDTDLRANYEAYWTAFTQQIRAARNDAGHPSSIEPISSNTVHASLLILPELIKLANQLEDWVQAAYP